MGDGVVQSESRPSLDLHDIVILELCCGTAGVTSCFKRHGLTSCVAVDRFLQKRPHARIIQLDLTDPHDQQLVREWLHHPNVLGVFWAPPCGTCSRAREIDIPDCDDPPRPLRSLEEPDGFTTLRDVDLMRVSQANMIYSFVAETICTCYDLGKLAMCENPRNSLFWFTTSWVEMDCLPNLYIADHQACAYGSMRPKWTRLVATFPEVLQICDVCPQNHKHAPWGRVGSKNSKRVFATSLEVHYPPELCAAIVRTFLTRLNLMGHKALLDQPTNADAQQFSGKQPSSAKLPPMVPEFKAMFQCFCNVSGVLCWPKENAIPNHFRLIHKLKLGDGSVDDKFQQLQSFCGTINLALLVSWETFCVDFVEFRVYGVPWEPMEFIQQAKSVGHPLKVLNAVPTILKDAVMKNLTTEPVQLAKERLRFALYWNSRSKELESSEASLKCSMDSEVASITASKRIRLFGEMLASVGYPDPGVIDELQLGVDMVGTVPETGMLPKKFSPALLTLDGLRQQAALLRKTHREVASSSGDPSIDEAVWKLTLEEVETGWITPVELEDIPVTSPISRRFGLVQKEKIRLIDDFSASGINSCVMVSESPSLHTIDMVGAMMSFWCGEAKRLGVTPELGIRTFDLSSAYRQLAVSGEGRQFAYIGVFNPTLGKTSYFQCRAVPFGAVRSVHSFLRLSRALWWLGTVGCSLMWTSYFDDFIVMSAKEMTHSSGCIVASIFKLTGWLYAVEGKKANPFGDCCKALGVLFDVALSSSGKIFIRNTDERVEELRNDILAVVKDGWILGSKARSLQGRMLFADSQIFGRVGRRCTRVLSKCSERHKYIFGEDDKFFLKTFVHMLKVGPPREIRSTVAGEGLMIFTDACYEKLAATWRSGIGGVFHNPALDSWRYFSLELLEDVLEQLGESLKEQLIFEAETLAAVVAYILWTPHITSEHCWLFVDNEGTKFCLIKGFSDNECVCKLVRSFALHEAETHIMSWIGRVPSYSNVADAPSRNDVESLLSLQAVDDSIEANEIMRRLINNL